MNPQEIRELFEKLKDAVTEPEEVAKLCEKYLSDTTPTYELSIIGATADAYRFIRSLKDRRMGLPLIEQLDKGLIAMLHERGYRNNIATHQEHVLCGSSGSGITPRAHEFPYTVGAVLNGKITVEEARKARRLEYLHGSAMGEHWGIGGLHCILLPDIDDAGLTVSDPVLVDSEEHILAEKLVDGAPYKRG
jgi:hypothetical protein